MTCGGCANIVQKALSRIAGISRVNVTQDPPVATITMERHIPTAELKQALKPHPRFEIDDMPHAIQKMEAQDVEEVKSFWQTYKPILLVFAFISGVTVLAAINNDIGFQAWMRYFMAAFFLVFSFFKFLDIQGFASSYATYDVVAKRWLGWGYVYPVVELTLGILYLVNAAPLLTNVATLFVMSISIIGVIQSLLAKRRIRCACLGAVFNLPMSTITLVEDGLMIGMSAVMIFLHAI